jgi:hypothetical protein
MSYAARSLLHVVSYVLPAVFCVLLFGCGFVLPVLPTITAAQP